MNRLSLIELHLTGLKRSMMGKIKGGVDIKCRCSFTNPLVSTRESGGSGTLCFCVELDGKVSAGVQSKPITTGHPH